MVLVIDFDGCIRYANEASRMVVGRDPSDLIGGSLVTALVDEPEHTSALRALLKAVRDTDVCNRVIKISDSEGRLRSVLWSSKRLDPGKAAAPLTALFAIDITRRRHARMALARSERLHRVTLSEISDAVFITDDELRFTYICPNVHAIFGWSNDEVRLMESIDELLGRGWFSPADLDRDGELSNIEHRVRDKQDVEHVLLINVKRVQIDDGTVLFSCRDITERKRTEDELQTAYDALAIERASLNDKNAAMREVLHQIESEKRIIEERVRANVDRLILPLVRSLSELGIPVVNARLRLLEESLSDVTSSFTNSLESTYRALTPREIEVCNLIRGGYSSKQIADKLHTSVDTVKNQRKTIRRKLGIANTETNLESLLRTL